jgi:hypothetical protein
MARMIYAEFCEGVDVDVIVKKEKPDNLRISQCYGSV